MSNRKDEFVSASELARLGYCERKVAFDAAYGRRATPAQKQAQARGLRAHDDFYREGQRIALASAKKGRCFVATLALGECEETRALRAYRDLFLRRSVVGRWFIAAYYRSSPTLCRWMDQRRWALAMARCPLRLLARLAAMAVRQELLEDGGIPIQTFAGSAQMARDETALPAAASALLRGIARTAAASVDKALGGR